MSTAAFVTVYAVVMAASVVGALLVPAILAGSPGRVARGRPGLGGVIAIAVGLAAWFGITSAVAAAGGYSADSSARWGFPLVGLGLLVPVAAATAAIWLVAPIRRLVSEPAVQPALIAVESYRVLAGGLRDPGRRRRRPDRPDRFLGRRIASLRAPGSSRCLEPARDP